MVSAKRKIDSRLAHEIMINGIFPESKYSRRDCIDEIGTVHVFVSIREKVIRLLFF